MRFLHSFQATPRYIQGLLLCFIPLLCHAETGWQDVNQAAVDQHLMPRYEQLASSTTSLSEQAHAFCSNPSATEFESLRERYHSAMDAWMGIQHMRFGPVTFLLRYERFHLWPDKHGTSARQLQRMLAEHQPEVLADDQFSQQSVAIQGFGALERLLYPSQLKLEAFGQAGKTSYRCDFLLAITDNLKHMAAGTLAEWRPGKVNYRQAIVSAESGNDYFESSGDISSRLLNNLHTQLQILVDQKLLLPMAEGKVRRAESWRSQRSLRNIRLNLLALQELYQVEFSPMVSDASLNQIMVSALQSAIDAANKLPSDAMQLGSPSEPNPDLEALLQSVRELKRLVASELPPAVGLILGFNSLDGD